MLRSSGCVRQAPRRSGARRLVERAGTQCISADAVRETQSGSQKLLAHPSPIPLKQYSPRTPPGASPKATTDRTFCPLVSAQFDLVWVSSGEPLSPSTFYTFVGFHSSWGCHVMRLCDSCERIMGILEFLQACHLLMRIMTSRLSPFGRMWVCVCVRHNHHLGGERAG